ncbi:MAG: hypothetical protein ACI4HN_00940 [Ruminococcus sp.]
MKKLLAILLAIVLTCGTTSLAFAAATEDEYDDDLFFDEATEDEAESELIKIIDFEILTLPDKVFTEPFDGKKSLQILSDEIKQNGHTSYDGPHMQYIKDTSVGYNMKGATAKVYFSDGRSYVYTFGEPFYGNYPYEKPVSCYMDEKFPSVQFFVSDIGNYQVEIFIPSEENEIKKTINVQNTSNPDKPDDVNSENGSQNIPENSDTKPINTTQPNDSATKDEVISGTSSTVNSDNNTIATGSGTLAVTILTLTILMSGIVAVYFLKKKRA